jgi:Caspase domain/WD domain, G-beta repeat
LAETQQPQRLTGHGNVATAVAFSSDSATLASASLDGDVRVWSMEDGRQVAAFKALRGEDGVALTLAFSPDGRMLATGAFGAEALQLWDVRTGRALRSVNTGAPGDQEAFAFSADGGTLAVAAADGAIELWDLVRGGTPRRLPSDAAVAGVQAVSPYESFGFSDDGRMLAGGRATAVDLWDLGTGRRVRTLARPRSPGAIATQAYRLNAIWPLAFSRDGRLLAGGADDGTIAFWDTASGQRLRTATGHRGNVTSVRWSADARTVLSGSDDATLRLWDTATGRELAQLIATDHTEGLVIAPDGLFDGATASWQKILWRFSSALRDVATVEVFFNEYFYPNLLAELLRGERPRARQDLAKRDRRQPEVRLSLGSTGGTAGARATGSVGASRRVTVRVSVGDTGAGARDLRLFCNGSLVKAWRGAVLAGQKSAQLDASVALVAGANRFVAYAFNDDNVKSGDGTLVVAGADGPRRAATLHVLSVGINRYANPAFDLNFAVADAEELAAEVRRQQEPLGQFTRVEAKLLLDRSATNQGVLGALGDLAQAVQPEDSVVLFFAGHGLAEDPRFYLIPHDLGYAGPRDSAAMTTRLRDVLAHGISDEELERALEPLDAAQVLLIIDACNSGQALETAEKRRGPMNSRGLAQLAYEKGMFILTAAQSYQAALETAQFGHGLLTYALVEEGLKKGGADARPADGQIVVREWFDYATRRVPLMQFEQMRRARQMGSSLAIVEGEENIPEIERRSLQRPRVFYRREPPASPLVIGRVGSPPARAGATAQ